MPSIGRIPTRFLDTLDPKRIRVGRISYTGWDQWDLFVNLWGIIGTRERLFKGLI